MGSNAPVRWGVVGLGKVVIDHLAPSIQRSGNRLTACAGRDPEKARAFAARFGVAKAYTSHDELVRDADVDAVYIATPNALHHAAVIAAARAGKHVLCEKPLALTEAEGREMVDAFRGTNLVFRVGFQIRFEEILQRVRAIVQSGTLGDLRSISFERAAPVGPKGAWRSDPRQGGILFDVAVHLLDLIPWLTGLQYREICGYSNPDRREGKPDDTIVIASQLTGGCHAVIRASREIPHAENNLVIQGTRGSVVTSALRWSDEYVLTIKGADGVREERFAPTPIYQREVEAFVGEIRGTRSVLPDGEGGVAMIRLANAVFDAINRRTSVSLD